MLVVNGVAAALVSGVREGASRDELVARLVARFDVASERAQQDVDALLRDLVSAGALVAQPSAPSEPPVSSEERSS